MNRLSAPLNLDVSEWEAPKSLAHGLGYLPLVGQTQDVAPADNVDYWHDVFSQVWGHLS